MIRFTTLHSSLIAGSLLAATFAAPARATILTGGYAVSGGDPITSGQAFFTAPDGNVTHVNDGQSTNFWLPNSGGTPANPITATIDLGRVYRLTDLNLTNSTFSQRATDFYTVAASSAATLAAAFGGSDATVVTLAGGTMPAPAAGNTDIAITANQVGRFVRFSGTVNPAVNFNGGLSEMSLGGVPNRAVSALQATTLNPDRVSAKALTRTTAQTDAAATWSLSLVTPTSGSVVQSLSKTVTGSSNAGVSYGAPADVITHVTNGVNDSGANELLFYPTVQPDLSLGAATVDLGQREIIDQISLRNSSFNSNGTKDYIIRVANNLSDFDDPNYTDLLSSHFTAFDELDNFTLGTPVIGRYVEFIAVNVLPGAFFAGLDELTVTGRTFNLSALASGTGAIGDSSNFGNIALGGYLPSNSSLLALDVTTPDGLNRESLQQVQVLPEPASLGLLAIGGVAFLRRRRA